MYHSKIAIRVLCSFSMVTNDDLSKIIDTDEWIQEKNRVQEEDT
jgi:hypothetical protein